MSVRMVPSSLSARLGMEASKKELTPACSGAPCRCHTSCTYHDDLLSSSGDLAGRVVPGPYAALAGRHGHADVIGLTRHTVNSLNPSAQQVPLSACADPHAGGEHTSHGKALPPAEVTQNSPRYRLSRACITKRSKSVVERWQIPSFVPAREPKNIPLML